MSSMNSLAHLRIPLDDIKLATNDFSNENVIGIGGFGKVYKGELSRSEGRIMVAVKRLYQTHGQGQSEFLMEIMMLSRYQHKNLVTLLGFCDEKDEMILVYEHEFHGSLDKHVSSINLTWSQRLKICCDVARGLLYLHNPDEGLQRVLHRDIKSSNILLDHMGKAKISDFGLAKLGPANQPFTFLVTHVVGTPGYCDPQYIETGILTKESDVYSFGVVLFEVLCGRLYFEKYDDGRRFLTQLVKQSFKENKLNDIIFDNIKEQMDPDSLVKFAAIAYRCLRKDRDERPTMAAVVIELEAALDLQEKRDANIVHMEGCSTGLSDLQCALSMFKQYRLRPIAQISNETPNVININFDHDDELFAIAGSTGFIKVFNFSKVVSESLVEYHPLVDIQTSSELHCLSWNKYFKNHIASSDEEGTVTIWDVNNKKSVMEYKEHERCVLSVDFSCTEPSLLVSGGTGDNKVKVWSTNQKTSVTIINMESDVNSVKYHPMSSMHIAVGEDNGCHYYDLRNISRPLNTFTRHKKCVLYVKFLSDDKLVSTSTNTLQLWDIKQNLLVGTYKGHTNQKHCVGLSVNNDFMACGSETNEVYVYHKVSSINASLNCWCFSFVLIGRYYDLQAFSKPVTCHAFGSPFANDNREDVIVRDVCWKSDGSAIVAGITNGVVQVLAFESHHG